MLPLILDPVSASSVAPGFDGARLPMESRRRIKTVSDLRKHPLFVSAA
jgi:hypothetical protein